MTKLFIRNQLGLALSCALALGVASGTASAQANTAYLIDHRGTLVKSGADLCWRTGYWTPAQAIAECDPDLVKTPAPVAKAAEPAAKPATAVAAAPSPAPKPAADKVKLDADTLFDFNKAVLRPAGMAALDAFVVKLKDIDPEVVMAVGHTDRFGSEHYNQQLSEQRATAVKTYLLGQGIAANRIHTEGKGEMQPVTKADACKGAKSAKVIACLQPDRRVDIEVVGTRIAK